MTDKFSHKQRVNQPVDGPVLAVAVYQGQIEKGYSRLRFDPLVESVYRIYHRRVSLARLRPALVIILVFAAAIAAANLAMSETQAEMQWLAVPMIVGVATLLCVFVAGFFAPGRRHLQSLGVIAALVLGFVSLLVAPHIGDDALPALHTAQLVIIMCAYLILGLRFWVAVPTGLCLGFCFIASALADGVSISTLVSHVIYVVVLNGAGATALYSLELSRRRDFLEEQVLEHLSRRDALTGLYNRQYMDETFARCWSRAVDEDRPIGVAIVDIDHFKNFNDEYGHQKGDECLRAVAAMLQEIARQDDNRVYRYGGEEFVILLANTSREKVDEFGDLVCRRIESLQIMHGKSTTAPVVTVSVGVAFTMPRVSKRNTHAFLQLADRALYAAKEAGRNRSVLAIGSDAHRSTGVYQAGVALPVVPGAPLPAAGT